MKKEEIFTEAQLNNFLRTVRIWASNPETSFRTFLRNEAVSGVENCTDIETGHLHIEEAKQVLQRIEDSDFIFELMQSEG